MDLLESDRIKLRIIRELAKENSRSISGLAKALGVNYDSVRRSCTFLELIGIVEIVAQGEGVTATRRVELTMAGSEAATRIPRNIPKGEKRRAR
jgi:predicted transcriptional regulator